MYMSSAGSRIFLALIFGICFVTRAEAEKVEADREREKKKKKNL